MNSIENSNVLVTGATGFLGKALALRLKQEGFSVTGIGRNLVDLTDFDQVLKITRNKKFVFHAAALTKSWGNYSEFYKTNVLGTKNLVDACLMSSVSKLIHISTPSIYMSHQAKFNISEDDPLPSQMINHYAVTKKLAEDEIDRASAAGLSCVTLRPQAIFGPGDITLLPRLLKIAQKGFYPVIGPEPVYLDLSYVDNVVDASMLALQKNAAAGLKFNITNGEPVCLEFFLKDLFARLKINAKPKYVSYGRALAAAGVLETLWKVLHKKNEPPLTCYGVCALGKSRTLNIDRAKKILNYFPRVSLEEGLARTASKSKFS